MNQTANTVKLFMAMYEYTMETTATICCQKHRLPHQYYHISTFFLQNVSQIT